jgi:hypothetical protein
MLSYILGIAFRFEREHGCAPNILYLGQGHMERLCAELGVAATLNLSDRLGLFVMVHSAMVHPHVAYLHQSRNAAWVH